MYKITLYDQNCSPICDRPTFWFVENLEEFEFQPMFDAILPKLKGKNISLFGSYGWGDGQWMRQWEEECLASGANMVHDYVICVETPDGEALEACRHMGEVLAIVQ